MCGADEMGGEVWCLQAGPSPPSQPRLRPAPPPPRACVRPLLAAVQVAARWCQRPSRST